MKQRQHLFIGRAALAQCVHGSADQTRPLRHSSEQNFFGLALTPLGSNELEQAGFVTPLNLPFLHCAHCLKRLALWRCGGARSGLSASARTFASRSPAVTISPPIEHRAAAHADFFSRTVSRTGSRIQLAFIFAPLLSLEPSGLGFKFAAPAD
jgi:hypothetical protein